MWFCTPYAPGHQRDPLAPGASWGQVGADGGTHPSAGVLRHGAPAGSCCRQGARTNLGGTGGPKQPTEHAVEDAVTWLSCSPFRNGPGGGLALRRQRGRCQVLAWLKALSCQVSVQPTGNTSQGEARRAASKACVWGDRVAALPWGCSTAPFVSPPVLPEPRHSRSSCMRLLPALLWMLWGRKAPGCSSPTWQAVSRSASSMLLPAPSAVE